MLHHPTRRLITLFLALVLAGCTAETATLIPTPSLFSDPPQVTPVDGTSIPPTAAATASPTEPPTQTPLPTDRPTTTAPAEPTPALLPTGYELTLDASRLASWVFAFGGEIYADGAYDFTSPATQEAMQFLQVLIDDGCARVSRGLYTDQTTFANGQTLFTVATSAGIRFYDQRVGFAWEVGAVPYTTPDPRPNGYSRNIGIAAASPERALAAWVFARHFTSQPVQAQWSAETGYFPVTQSITEQTATYLGENPLYASSYDLLPYIHSEPAVPGYGDIRTPLMRDALGGIARGDDLSSVLAALKEAANADHDPAIDLMMEDVAWEDVDPTGQTITLWHQYSPSFEAALQTIIAEFNASNAYGITVIGRKNTIDVALPPVVGTEAAPDLYIAFPNQVATHGTVDVRPLVGSAAWGLPDTRRADLIAPNELAAGIPAHYSMDVMYVNTDWLEQLRADGLISFEGLPQTPRDFREAACAAAWQPFE